jgi:glyoxylase-like metal-dependent hydrolase (beta-lactamase superfamily II)
LAQRILGLRIEEGLWQLRIPMSNNSLGYTYSYLLVDAATLIDTGVGTSEARSSLKNQLKEAGLKISDIERIIVTHLHHDHVGLVNYIKSVSGAEVYAHQKAEDILKSQAEHSEQIYYDIEKEVKLLGGRDLLRLSSMIDRPLRGSPNQLQIDKTLSDGDLLRLKGWSLKVFWTPGHAPEEICLYDADRRILFSGDHVLPRITPHISLRPYEDANPLGDYLNALEKIRGLPVKIVLPAHEHAFEDLDSRIEELKRHHEARCNEIRETLKKGAKTVFQISAKISWSSPWLLMPFWTKRMAAAETLAHLAYLKNQGEIEERTSNGVLYYRLRKQK